MVNKKIKICHVINTDFAAKFLLLTQLRFLQNVGYDVCIICSDGKLIEDIKKEGIRVETIKIIRKISPLDDLVTLFKSWNYFRKGKFDIVHTHTAKPALLGQMAAKMAGVPVIINTVHGLYFHDNSTFFRKKFYILIEKIDAKFSDLIFSQNKEDIETLIRENIAEPKKIKYLGNGVDIEKFNSERFSKGFIDKKKEEFNIPMDFKVVGVVARLVKEKGYLDLFDAFKKVLKIFPKTILLVIGPKEPEKKDGISPEIIKNYGIDKNVIFLGQRSDVNEIFSLMDIFVLPSASYREGLPRSILEAMAEKRAIIATNTRGCREEIENGKSGILVPVKNPVKLAEAIVYLLSNKDKADDMAEAARVRVEKEFDERLVFGRIKEEYERLIDKKIK